MMMMNKASKPSPTSPKRKGGNFLPALCGVFGTLIIVLVIVACVPLTVPRLLGYEIYEVVSGSMAPEIPVGSVIYVKHIEPEEIQEQEIIAFWKDAVPVTHRVLENHKVVGEFITKGDANEIEDFEPVPYDALIGRVEHHFPMVGSLLTVLASGMGKLYLLCFAACGVMFNILASRLSDSRREREILAESEFIRNYEFGEKKPSAVDLPEDQEAEISVGPKKPRREDQKNEKAPRSARRSDGPDAGHLLRLGGRRPLYPPSVQCRRKAL